MRTGRILVVVVVGCLASACGTRLHHDAIVDAAGTRELTSPGTVTASAVRDAGVQAAPTTGDVPEATATRVLAAGVAPRSRANTTRTTTASTKSTATNLAPLRIGSVGTQSGPVGATIGESVKAVQAWARAVNDRGGVNGRRIELVVGDDGGDPSRYRALVQEFVEQRRVLGFVQATAALTGQAGVEYLNAKQVPVIGSEGGSDWIYASPVFFPQMTSGRELIAAALRAPATTLVPQHKTKLGTLNCQEAQFCADADRDWNGPLAKQLGFTTQYRGRASLAQPDYTAECLSARSAGVQVMAVTLDANSMSRLARACARQGFRPTYLYALSSSTARHKDEPDLDGAYITLPMRPWFLDGPALNEYRATLASTAPGLERNATSALGWASAKLLEAAVQAIPQTTTQPTSKDLVRALTTIRANDLGGLTYPLAFAAGQRPPRVSCGFLVHIEHRQFTSPNGGRPLCR